MIEVPVPGDKSISHRALILAPLAEGTSRISGLCDGADVLATGAAMRALGADMAPCGDDERDPFEVRGGPLSAPAGTLDCGNSGTTARLLAGLLAGTGIGATLDGDASLRRRPMRRVIYPLQAMGLRAEYLAEAGRLPVRLLPRASGSLRALRHRPRVASAQVKSAILLAGLAGRTPVAVLEPARSRDHTERLLRAMGAPLATREAEGGHEVVLDPRGWDGTLRPLELQVPGDPSSAAFLAGAALLAGRTVRVPRVSENPTRIAFLDILAAMGARIDRDPPIVSAGEPLGSWTVHPGGALRGFDVGGAVIPALIDELPLLAVLAARADGSSTIRDAAELRVKESDRLALLAANLAGLGVRVDERPDGLVVHGTAARLEGRVTTGGDHRIAMAFAVLGVDPAARIEVDDPGCASVSFPGFPERLERIRRG